MTQNLSPIKERLIRLDDVKIRTGLSRSTIYAWISANKFPKPINLGARSVSWIEREIDEWIIARISQSRN